MLFIRTLVALLLIAAFVPAVHAEDLETYIIVIKDHKFSPAEIVIPANKKVKLLVQNQDPTPEEFESYDLNREKVVGGNKEITVYVGPLKAKKYKFFGDFHQEAQGVLIVQ